MIATLIACVVAFVAMAIAPAVVYLIDRPGKHERQSERNNSEHQL